MKVRGSKMLFSEGPRRWDHWKIRGCLLGGEIRHWITAFFGFSQKVKKWPFCFANFSLKTASTDKMEYTTMKPMKNTSKLSSHIFDFRNYVTEIFCFKFLQKFKLENMKKIVKTEELYSHIVRTSSDLKSKLISAYWSSICLFKSRNQYL